MPPLQSLCTLSDMARFYVNNDIYFQDSAGAKTVLKYVNETTKRLYCNQFDLLPDVYAAKYGSVTILRNGIKEFSSKSTDGATNPLRRYVQYSVSDRLRWLDREESLEIVLEQSKGNLTTKLGISLVLDFTAAPGPAQNIPRDPLTLAAISERHYVNNDIYFQDSAGAKTVLRYTNETTKRLYCNQFDLFPDVYAAQYGSVTILRNGIKEFSSKSTDGATNSLRRYVQYSVNDRLRWLDRGESLEIVLEQDKADITTKLGVFLVLDFTAVPGPAQNVTRDPLTLAAISETLLLADGVVFDRTPKAHHNLPIDVKQYNKMVITIDASALVDPLLLRTELNPSPTPWVAQIAGSYLGNTRALRRIGSLPTSFSLRRSRSGTIYWEYAGDDDDFRFYRADGTTFAPSDRAGSYVAIRAGWNIRNPGKNRNAYSLTFTAPASFAFSVRYEYLTRIYRYGYYATTRPSGRSYYRYTWEGRTIIATQTQEIQILGYDKPDFSDAPTVIETIVDAPHTELTREFVTDKKYVRLVSTAAYVIDVDDYLELVDEDDTSIIDGLRPETSTDPHMGLARFYNTFPSQGFLALPNRVMAYHNPAFPANTPERVRSFQRTVHTALPDIGALKVAQFRRAAAGLRVVTLALQIKDAAGQWFDLLADIGPIKPNGKTVLTLSSDDFTRGVVFVREPDTMRLLVVATAPVTLSIAATLTN